MHTTDRSHASPSAVPENAREQPATTARRAAHGVGEFSRAQQAAALAAADHRHPDRMRRLYLGEPSARDDPPDGASTGDFAADLHRGRVIAMQCRCAALVLVLGLIVLVSYTI